MVIAQTAAEIWQLFDFQDGSRQPRTADIQSAPHNRGFHEQRPMKSKLWFSLEWHYVNAQLLSTEQAVQLTFSTNCVFASIMKSLNTLCMRTFVNCQQTKNNPSEKQTTNFRYFNTNEAVLLMPSTVLQHDCSELKSCDNTCWLLTKFIN